MIDAMLHDPYNPYRADEFIMYVKRMLSDIQTNVSRGEFLMDRVRLQFSVLALFYILSCDFGRITKKLNPRLAITISKKYKELIAENVLKDIVAYMPSVEDNFMEETMHFWSVMGQADHNGSSIMAQFERHVVDSTNILSEVMKFC